MDVSCPLAEVFRRDHDDGLVEDRCACRKKQAPSLWRVRPIRDGPVVLSILVSNASAEETLAWVSCSTL